MMMHKFLPALLSVAVALAGATTARAAFLIQIDTDGVDDGVLTFSPNFAFGSSTTAASESSPSAAVGLATADSIYGGNATSPDLDTYVFTYTPSTTVGDVDNLALAGGTALNDDGATASGQTAGTSGLYAVYATWPESANVSGGPTTYDLTHDAGTLSVQIDQDSDVNPGIGDEWFFLGNVNLTEGSTYNLNQIAGANTFVSMRAAGVMFDRIPEPGSALLLLAGAALPLLRRRRG